MNDNFRQHIKFLIMCAVRVIICSLAGVLLLVLVYLIPTNKIDNNVRDSAMFFDIGYPSLHSWCNSKLDRFTDAYILLEASYDNNDNISILQSVMKVQNYNIESLSPDISLKLHYLYNVEFNNISTYTRYWHGYLIFIKPIFFFLNYSNFIKINFVIQAVLLIFLIFLFIKRDLKYYIIPYLISYMFLVPSTLFSCIQYSSCYYIYTVSSIILLLFNKNISNKNLYILFLYTGVSLAYFDFLTYPIATFGIPAIIYFIMTETNKFKISLKKLSKMLFFWGFGYGFMWFLKWLWASIILRENIFLEAFSSIEQRTSIGEVSLVGAFRETLVSFFTTPVSIILILFLIILSLLILYKSRKEKNKIYSLKSTAFIFIIIAFLPLIWYLFSINHSGLHCWFTCKALTVLVFSIMCLMVKTVLKLKKSTTKE